MAVTEPYLGLDELMINIGSAGLRMSQMEASEGAAGNLSIYIGYPVDPRRKFPISREMELPLSVPELAGKSFLVTGSGRRLGEVHLEPALNLGFLRVNEGGKTGTLYTAPGCYFERLTSEFNSHLAVHYDQVLHTGTNFHAIIHAQPPQITYLSHIPRYQDTDYLNKHLLRWQPETIVQLPEGVGFIPFEIPGSEALMRQTVEGLRKHRLVVWSRHGVMARSDVSIKRAADRIDYAEAGARYEFMNLLIGEQADGLSREQLCDICNTFGVLQTIFPNQPCPPPAG